MEEIELTFLPKSLPDLTNVESKEMLDIYIPKDSEFPNLRIRRQGERYEITKKERVGSDFSHHIETTIPLTKAEYELLQTLEGKRTAKTRFYYHENGVSYEIDVFKEKLAGLVVVDIEFNSAKEKDEFKAPEWLGTDITQEEFIAGANICGKSYEDIKEDLDRLNYIPM